MKFATRAESEEWCSLRGHCMPSHPPAFPLEDTHWRFEFHIPSDAGARVALCRAIWDHADDEDKAQRLLLVETWGVWPSGEHPPLFERLRSSFGEHRHLIEAPGQIIDANEARDGFSLFIVCVLFLWDCWVYGSCGHVVMMSHDEYGLAFGRKDRNTPELLRLLTHFK